MIKLKQKRLRTIVTSGIILGALLNVQIGLNPSSKNGKVPLFTLGVQTVEATDYCKAGNCDQKGRCAGINGNMYCKSNATGGDECHMAGCGDTD